MVRCAKCSNSWLAQTPNEIDVIGSLPSLPPSAFEPARLGPPKQAGEAPSAFGTHFGSFGSSSTIPGSAPLNGAGPLLPAIPPGSNLPVPHKEPMPIWLRYAAMACGIFIGITIFLWLILGQKAIMKQWPATKSVYDIVGLHGYDVGDELVLDNVRSELKYEDGIMRLVVQGTISNKTENMQDIPNLTASAIGSDGDIMQSWQIDAPTAKLAPHESAPFQSSINAPKGTVINVNLNFIEPKDGDQ